MANPQSDLRVNRVKVLRMVLVLVGLFLICYVERHSKRYSTAFAVSCPPCSCDCTLETTRPLPSELFGDSFADCGKDDAETQAEMKKDMTALMTEEIELNANVTGDALQRTHTLIMIANRGSSHYQREAEKCNVGVQTCEEARERAEVALIAERKLTALWMSRAQKHGWGDELKDKL